MTRWPGRGTGKVDLRHTLHDGTQIVVASRQALQRAPNGRPTAIIELSSDVTEQRDAELALRDAEERFRRAFDEAPIGMAMISADGRLEQANTALAAICGCTRGELEECAPRAAAPRRRGQRNRGAPRAGRRRERTARARPADHPGGGSPVDVSVHATRLRHRWQPKRLLCQFLDVTDRKRFEAQLQFMADHDPLTGLLNRRKFEAELDRHVEHVKRYGPEGAVLVLDLDHFKTINDTLGHNAGDQLIVSIASVLRQRLRASDILARLGGDEFAVLLPKADRDEAAEVADAIVTAIRTNTALLGGERKTVTSSLGDRDVHRRRRAAHRRDAS